MHLNKKIIFGVVFLAVFGASFVAVNIPTAHAYVYCQDSSGNVTKKAFECRSEEKIVSEEDFKNPNKYENVAQPSDSVCSLSGTNGLAICISNLVYYIMVGVFSSIAYIAAFFFDLAVQLSLNSTTYALGFLTTSWTIIRDLSNMAFIFILIYIAVEVMLTADNSQTLKTLAAVIVVALLVNFSFFFTRVAIDAGNLLALQFYNAIEGHPIGQNPAGTGLDSTLKGGSTNAAYNKSAADFMSGFTALASGGGPLTPGNTKDLTASIMDGIQVQNIVNTQSFKNYAASTQSSPMYILITLSTIYIAVGIAFGVLAGAFLFAGAKFIMRIVGLWFVIILSPLALVAATLPNAGAKKLFRDWLNHLINFSFYPAAFLFMFFVLSRFMKELNAGGNFLSGVFASSPAGFSDGTFGFITILSAIANVGIRLGFVIAMMYLALSAADMLARSRGDMTSGWARTAAGWMGNAITGGAIGWTGRNTIGLGARLYKDGLSGLKPKFKMPELSTATFDPRNLPGIRSTVRPLLGGYDPATKTPYGTFGAVPINWGQAPSATDAAKAATEASKERDRKKREDEFHALLKKAANNPASLTPVETDRLNKADKKEIAAANGEQLAKAAKVFSEKTAEKILEKEDFKEKDAFHKNWHEEAKGAPLNKTDEMVNELKTINSRLATPLPGITTIARNDTINKALINPLKDALEAKRDDAQTDHGLAIAAHAAAPTAATLATVRAATTQLRVATQAFEKAKGIAETLGKVPLGVGGEADAGAFKKK